MIYLFYVSIQRSGDQNIFKFIYHILSLMKAYIVLVTTVFLITAAAISVNTMTAYAQGGANMTGGDASRLAPNGAAKGIVAQGEKIFIVVCPRDFQSIKQCEIFTAQPTLVAIKTVKPQ
jgi:hypothetical protein